MFGSCISVDLEERVNVSPHVKPIFHQALSTFALASKPNANEMYMHVTQLILPIFYMTF